MSWRLMNCLLCFMGLSFVGIGFAEQRPVLPLASEYLQEHAELSCFTKALAKSDRLELIDSLPELTLFVPHNSAFTKWSQKDLDTIFAHRQMLQTLVDFHITESRITTEEAKDLNAILMENGGLVSTEWDGTDLWINGARVLVRDIQLQNGMMHIIETILEP